MFRLLQTSVWYWKMIYPYTGTITTFNLRKLNFFRTVKKTQNISHQWTETFCFIIIAHSGKWTTRTFCSFTFLFLGVQAKRAVLTDFFHLSFFHSHILTSQGSDASVLHVRWVWHLCTECSAMFTNLWWVDRNSCLSLLKPTNQVVKAMKVIHRKAKNLLFC